jgi:copper transport protein
MSPSAERRWPRGAALLGGVLLWLLVSAGPASAHAVLVDSQPSGGARLAAAPHTVRLQFSEDVSRRFSSATLVDGEGHMVAGTGVVAGPSHQRLLTLQLPALPAGAYGVLWQALSETDGHTTRGAVVFNVGEGAESVPDLAGAAQAAAQPGDVARRWVEVCLLAGLIGSLAVAGFVLGRAGSPRPGEPLRTTIRATRSRLLAFAAGCAVAGAVVHVADVLAEAARHAPAAAGSLATSGSLIAGTRWGQLWLAREVALLALVVLALRLRSRAARPPRPSRRALGTGIVALVALVVTVEAMGSHAAALDSARPAAVAADALHILTACLWLGMLPAFVLMLWPQRGVGGGLADLLQASRRPFTGLAAGSVALLVVTGLYSAGREVATVDGLWSTSYGRALLTKGGLLLVVGGLGLVNSARLHGWSRDWLGRSGRRLVMRWPSRRLVVVEATAGALLLVAVGVLVESPPARGPATAAPPAAPAAQTVSGSVADLVVTVSVTPNRPGVNGFTLLSASARRPPPAPVDGVSLELPGGGDASSVALQQVAPGRWFGTGRLGQPGPLRLKAVVRRGGKRLAVPLSSWVGPPVPPGPAEPAPGRRLAPWVDGLALSLTVGAALGAGWLLQTWRRRRRVDLVQPTRARERALEGTR